MMRRTVLTALVVFVLVRAHGAVAGLTDGLVAYYPFNGTAQDGSGEGNDGEMHGGTFVADRCGVPNAACSFNGTSDYMWIGDYLRPEALSVSLWFKTTTKRTCVTNAPVIIRDRYYGHVVMLNPSNQVGCVQVDVWSGPAVQHSYVSTGVACNDGTWHHIAYTWDQFVFRVYLDGKEMYSDSNKGNGPMFANNGIDGGGLALGRDGNFSSGYYEGCIDDVCIYNRALTADEVTALHTDRTNLAAAAAAAKARPQDPLAIEFPNAERIAVLPLDATGTKKIVAALRIEKRGTQEVFVTDVVAKGFKAVPVSKRKPFVPQGNGQYQYAYVSGDAISLTSYVAAAGISASRVPATVTFTYYCQNMQATYAYSSVTRMDEGTNQWTYMGRGMLKKAGRRVVPTTIGCMEKPALVFSVKTNSRLKMTTTAGRSITATRNGAPPVPTVVVKNARGVVVTNEQNTSFG